MEATHTEKQAILECYRRMFKASTPSGDFDELLARAEKNDIGEKVIPFMDYEIEESVFTEILENIIKEFKIKKYRQGSFLVTIELGCSPKFKK